MFMCFDLSICFRHYPTSQHVMSDFPSLINLWIIPNLQVHLWIFIQQAIVRRAPIQKKSALCCTRLGVKQRRQKQVLQTSIVTGCKEQQHFRMTDEHWRLYSISWCFAAAFAKLPEKVHNHSIIHQLINCKLQRVCIIHIFQNLDKDFEEAQ